MDFKASEYQVAHTHVHLIPLTAPHIWNILQERIPSLVEDCLEEEAGVSSKTQAFGGCHKWLTHLCLKDRCFR